MRMFKVYTADETTHKLVLAKTPFQAACIARTVWDESGTPNHHVNVVELCLPSGDVGLVYEPNTTPTEYPAKVHGCRECRSFCGVANCGVCRGDVLCSRCQRRRA
jgi:hypothetical protein